MACAYHKDNTMVTLPLQNCLVGSTQTCCIPHTHKKKVISRIYSFGVKHSNFAFLLCVFFETHKSIFFSSDVLQCLSVVHAVLQVHKCPTTTTADGDREASNGPRKRVGPEHSSAVFLHQKVKVPFFLPEMKNALLF